MRNRCAFTNIGIFINTLVLGAAASLSHYLYDLSGKNFIVGLFNPVSESVWEHLKLVFFPFLLWWVIIYIIKSKKYDIPLYTWIESAAVSLIVAPLSVILLYYGYTGAFGIESVFIDVLLAFICYFIALCIGAHYLEYSVPNKNAAIVSVIIIVIIFAAFIVFTINPPKLPIFFSNNK